MRKIDKILAFFLITLFSQQLKAQAINFIAGYSSSTFALIGDDTSSEGLKAKPGFHIGASTNIKIAKNLNFQPGLSFQSKGTKEDISNFGFSQKTSVNLYYLEIPLNLVGNFEINKKLSVYVSAGPYIGFGLSGNSESVINVLGVVESTDEKIVWGTNFERLDFGLGLGTGLKYQNYLIGLSYDYGFANIAADPPAGNYARNTVFRLSIGYTINL
tara:strand:+ start:2189 stop:2833 length:645 start_codon:yes stop_codon:yes gene_type:complete